MKVLFVSEDTVTWKIMLWKVYRRFRWTRCLHCQGR